MSIACKTSFCKRTARRGCGGSKPPALRYGVQQGQIMRKEKNAYGFGYTQNFIFGL